MPNKNKNEHDADTNTSSSASQAGTQTGQTQAEAGAGYRSVGAEVTSDIGQAEMYILNGKRLVAGELDHSEQLRQTSSQHFTDLNNIALQSLQNAVTLANRVANNAATHDEEQFSHRARVRSIQESDLSRNLRTGALADDRTWNINEDSAFATIMAVKIAEILKGQGEG